MQAPSTQIQPVPGQQHYPGLPPPQGNPPIAGSVQYINGQAYIVQTPTQTSNNGPKVWLKYRAKASIVLGSILLVSAFICVIINIVGLIKFGTIHRIKRIRGFDAFHIGHGFWGSIFFALAGSFAVCAGKKRTSCTIIANMVLCIIAMVIAGIGQLVGAGIGIGETESAIYRLRRFSLSSFPYVLQRGGFEALLAMHSVFLVLTLLQVVCALVLSAFCCATVCCGKKAQQAVPIQNHQIYPQQMQNQPQFVNAPNVGTPMGQCNPPPYNPAGVSPVAVPTKY